MLSIHGIYENGTIKILDPLPFKKKAKVIITILDEDVQNEKTVPLDMFDELTGVISAAEDSSANHDEYIYSKENV